MKKYLGLLKNHPIFQGLTEDETAALLDCLQAVSAAKRTGEYIFRMGDPVSAMGLVLSGSVLVTQEDLWGNRSILAKISAGGVFGAPFAATPGSRLGVNVAADSDSEILFLQVSRLLTSCSSACDFHARVIRNFVAVLSGRLMALNDKVTHMSRRSTRDKLLSYLSAESFRQGGRVFDIPYNRQQLADYLCVDRAAMSVELSRLQKDGILNCRKNHFELLQSAAFLQDARP
ncbi:MAG: Crp/Fnr family transcriptional regulator [Desulfovibrionaceae bacterium]|nr:Crp/Fnr family transcriptional regulator [Desulfovibrionaceae bacterium]